MQHLIFRMQPHLRGNNCTLTKPRCAGQVRLSFSRPTRVVKVWNSLPSDTTDFSFAQVSCISYYALFAEILYSLFWLMPPRFQRFRSVRIASSMLIVSVAVLATCKWLLALCCSVNLIWRRGEAQACTCNKQSHYKVRRQRCGDCGVFWTVAELQRLHFASDYCSRRLWVGKPPRNVLYCTAGLSERMSSWRLWYERTGKESAGFVDSRENNWVGS